MDRARADALQAAVAALAAEDVADVVAQARAEARVRVKDLLADALTDALVDSVHAELAHPQAEPGPAQKEPLRPAPVQQRPAQRQPPEPEPPREPAPSALGLYVYGIVAAGAGLPGDLPGIDPEHPPRMIVRNGLAAVVSDVPLHDFEEHRLRENLGDMRWVERIARAHEHVLERVADHTTLIPLRMCSIYRTSDGVQEMLAREADALTEALRQLAGKAEWGVKVFGAATTPRRDPAGAEDAEPPASGTDYMRQRQTERDARWRADDELLDACAAIHEALRDLSADALTAPPQRPEVSGHDGPMLLNGVYLVETVDHEVFLARVEELQARYEALGITLVPTGPWPAYNFVPGAIGATW